MTFFAQNKAVLAPNIEEEGSRIKMQLRSVEMEGVSLAKQLVRKDLKSGEPCGRPGCSPVPSCDWPKA